MAEDGLALLKRARTAEAVVAAFSAVTPDNPELREAIRELYDRISTQPQRLDADCAIRTALLQRLRPVVMAADVPLLETAVQTYEFGVLGEKACNLRAAALLTLGEIDERRAAFHATRLLADGFTAAGTRQPALMAVGFLAAIGETMPLYLHLLKGGPIGDEAAGCFRALKDAPAPVLLDLIDRWQSSGDEPALLGLFDTLLPHPELHRFSAFVTSFIDASPLIDLVGYVATVIVAEQHAELIEELKARANLPGARGRRVRDALALRPNS